MKKNTPILIIAIALLSVAAYLILSQKKGTIKQELSDFAVSDTSSIDKVFLVDKSGKEGHQVLLERDPIGAGWLVNKQFEARTDAIDLLLTTIASIEVRSPVAKAAYENVMKRLAATANKIEIYQNGKLSKTYYVGGASADQQGTFMYLENSSVPFVIHIPGFTGYLTPRYNCEAGNWKTKTVFKANGSDIASIKIMYRDFPGESFEIRNEDSKFHLYDIIGNERTCPEDRLINYVSQYNRVNFEGYFDQSKTDVIDSVMQIGHFQQITLTMIDGSSSNIKLYRKPVDEESKKQFDDEGEKMPYDIDRMMGILNDDPMVILAQYYVFDKLSRSLTQLADPQ